MVGSDLVDFRRGEVQTVGGKVDKVDSQRRQAGEQARPDLLLVVQGVKGGPKSIQEVGHLEPGIALEPRTSRSGGVCHALERHYPDLGKSREFAVIFPDPLVIVIVLGHNSKRRRANRVANAQVEDAQVVECLVSSEDKRVVCPKRLASLLLECAAGCQTAGGELVLRPLPLSPRDSRWVERRERVDDGVITAHRIPDDDVLDFERQCWEWAVFVEMESAPGPPCDPGRCGGRLLGDVAGRGERYVIFAKQLLRLGELLDKPLVCGPERSIVPELSLVALVTLL